MALVWLIAAALAVVSAIASIGASTKQLAPQASTSMWPSRGAAMAVIADRAMLARAGQMALQPTFDVDPALTRHAREALELEPTSASSLRILAYDRAARGDTAGARRLMLLATGITKRDLLANYWLMNDYARAERVDELLAVYDQTLRTLGEGRGPVLTMLASALADGRMVEPMLRLLRRQPPWSDSFWHVAAQTPAALENAARLRILAARNRLPVPREKDEMLLAALADRRLFDAGREVYATLGSDRRGDLGLVANGDFSRPSALPPFEWLLASSGELGAGIDQSSGKLEISALGGSSGEVARQLVRLDPGRYRLDSLAELRTAAGSGSAQVELTCAEAASPPEPRFAWPLQSGRASRTVDLSGDRCRYYWLAVKVDVPEGSSGFEVGLDRLRMARN